MSRCLRWCLAVVVAACATAPAQVIRFESNGLEYQTLSRGGLTIMFAHLPSQVREYSIVQAAVSNGSNTACEVQTQAFEFRASDGKDLHAEDAETVVSNLLSKASRGDVIKLISTYEIGLYGMSRFRSTNGYEQRRQAAQASMTSTKLSAAAAASAIAFVDVKLNPGESTDGALFFPSRGRLPDASRLRISACGQQFEFEAEPAGR